MGEELGMGVATQICIKKYSKYKILATHLAVYHT